MGETQREPILEDIKSQLETITSLTREICEQIDNLHYRLDKDLTSDKPRECEKVAAEKPTPNLRFDMYKLANISISNLESIVKNIVSFKAKMVDLRTKADHP